MPIYEFKCLDCNEFFEVLVTRSEEDVEMACPKCKSETFERVLSATGYMMADGGPGKGLKKENRQCSGGSCTTYELPGATRP